MRVRPERGRVLRWGLAAAGLYAGAFAVLSLGGYNRSLIVVALAVVLLIAAAVFLHVSLSRAREGDVLRPAVRLLIPLGIMAAGAVLGAYWWIGTQRGFATGGWGLAGLCAVILGTGHLLTELRWQRIGAPWRGAAVAGACAVAYGAGLYLGLERSVPWLALALAGLLLAPVGLALLSEDLHRHAIRLGLALGPALALGGGLWLAAGTDFAWPLVAVLFVLVGAIASNTQADVLLVVTVIALIWAAAPRGVAPVDTIEPDSPALVALGDSYMSGEGAKTYFEGTNDAGLNECRRSPTAYAHLVVRREGGHLAFLACSGAVAPNLHSRPQWRGEPVDSTPESGAVQLDQLRALLERSRLEIRLVLVSIGGNDAGFATIGMACLAPGSCVERGQAWLDRLARVRARVEEAYRRIRATVGPEVPVLAVPYPQPISSRACPYSLLADDEHRFLNGYVRRLNGVIRDAARAAGFRYLAAMEGALGEELRICDAEEDEIGVNFIALDSINGVIDQVIVPTNWIHNSLHPNERGHEAMAGVLESWLRRPGPELDVAATTPGSVEDIMQTSAISYCGGRSEPDYCDRGDVEWTITQIALVAAGASVPALLVVAGWWLFWLPILAAVRRRRS